MSNSSDLLMQTGDGSGTLFSPRYQQSYHSRFGAVTESKHTYLQNSGVFNRLKLGQATAVLEIGFGLGLNFLLTADLAISHACPLHYTAFEHDLIDLQQFKSLNYSEYLQNPRLVDQLSPLFQVSNLAPRITYRSFSDSATCELRLEQQDISQTNIGLNHYDAVYLDAFSPDVNPECWTLQMFQQLHQCMKPDAILVTYSVKGSVRRNLINAGFSINKCPGPAGKREILHACAHK